MPEAPATNGAIGRTNPMKRPISTVAPPRRRKCSSTCASRSGVILNFGPCLTRKLRPRRRPRKKLTVSPLNVHAQTSGISTQMSIVPCPAITPPSRIVNSPGATRPMKAPVSAKAMTPTSA
jgi:hypothetical protein